MAEYIEREALLLEAERDSNFNLVVRAKTIQNFPAADVALVRRGHWERYHGADLGWDEWGVKCTNCGFKVEDKEYFFPYHYCPHCGCFMLEDEE